jgi:hypothetical protein
MTAQAPGNVEQMIHVRNINYEMTSKALWQVFGKFGSVKAVRLIATFDWGEIVSMKSGFVEFHTPEAARAALDSGNGWWLMAERWCSAHCAIRARASATLRSFSTFGRNNRRRCETGIRSLQSNDCVRDSRDRRRPPEAVAFVTFATDDDQTKAVRDLPSSDRG